MKKIIILGTGIYAKALARILAQNGYKVILWGIVEQEISDINQHLYNGIVLNKNITATNNLSNLFEGTDFIVFAVPAHSIDNVSKKIANFINKPMIFINATKGFDPTTGERLSLVIKKNLKNKVNAIAGIYGPSLAWEIMQDFPTQVTVACEKPKLSQIVKKLFNNNNFSVTVSDDLIGIECLSAIKNVIGIIAGILKAQKVSDNTFAAMIAVAINEAMSYIVKQGGKLETILTQAGIGDLMLSCLLPNSRNYKFGYQVGMEQKSKQILQELNTTVEGFLTSKVIYQQKSKLNLNLPLFNLLYEILFEDKNPKILANYFKNFG